MTVARDIVYGLIAWFIVGAALWVLVAYIGLLQIKFRPPPSGGRARTAGVSRHGPARPAVLADRPLHLVDRA